MKLIKKEVEGIANLARLSLTPNELKMYSEQLSSVLSYVELLDEVDTENIVETSQVTGLVDISREDVVQDCPEERKEKLIEQFPDKEGRLLKVHKIF